MGVAVTEMHLCDPQFRLASATAVKPEVERAELDLYQYERHFVPLRPLGRTAWPRELAQMLAGVVPLAQQPAEMQRDLFILFVFGDRLREALPIVREVIRVLGPESVTVRPFCFCAAVILNFKPQ